MTTEIFAEAGWYRERPEPEAEWQGVLRARSPVIGPASRTALTYALATEAGQLPIYVADSARKFAPYADRPVVLRGKLVDLSQAGFGPELWVASIQLADQATG